MKQLFIALMSLSLLSSCSVAMAAKHSGTNISKVQDSKSRASLLSLDPEIVSSERGEEGQLVETYKFQKEKGSIARAFMHGVLDLSTFGAWEVIGTPMEGMNAKQFFVVKVYYDNNEQIQKVELP